MTWAGLQAPCSAAPYRISYTLAIAASQGANAGSAAVSAASAYGFTGKNVYYLDIEPYNTGNVSCRNAVNAFVSGWSGRLSGTHQAKPGVYGSGCTTAASDWATIQNPPWVVWLADWNYDPDVWGLCGVSDGYWIYDQRLHQFIGDSYETFGSYGLTIDWDCASGLVTPHGYTGAETVCTQE